MRAYINDEGLPTIRVPRLVQEPKIVNITSIVDEIVAHTEPPKRHQKFVLNQTISKDVRGAFEGYIVKMMIDDGWRNGDSEFVEVKDIWVTTHTVRHLDKDGNLCIGGCDGKGRKFVEDLRRKGWLDSFLSCYEGTDHPELRVFFFPARIPPKLRVLDWWDSNKVKLKQGFVALSNSRPFEMSEESISWWLRNRRWLFLHLTLISLLLVAMLTMAFGLGLGVISLPESADPAIIAGILTSLVVYLLVWVYPPIWRKITAETPIDWGNGTIHDGTNNEKVLAFYDNAKQEWGIA